MTFFFCFLSSSLHSKKKSTFIMDRQLRSTLMLTHGGLMAFVWLVAVPLAVGASMYARKKNKTWGVKLHMITMLTAAFLPFTISSLMAYYVAGTARIHKPHSVRKQKGRHIQSI